MMLIFSNASAEIIDTIEVQNETNGDVKAIIKFLVPIQKVRYFPTGKANYLEVFFNILETVPSDQWQNFESKRSPPTTLITSFTVTTRDLKLGPKIQIQFDHPVEYAVHAGLNEKSIILIIKSAADQDVNPLQVSGHLIPSKIGAKEGLPPFPEIILPVAKINEISPIEEQKNLNEVVRAANDQAAIQMAKAEESLIAGQVLSAIASLNKVLNLPSNKYTEDAQLWIGIAREKGGQTSQAIAEFDTYIKLYPNANYKNWVTAKLSTLRQTQSASKQSIKARPVASEQASAYQTSHYGSLSMFYYNGASQSTTVSTVGGVQTSSSLSNQDQSALFTNVIATMRTNNNEYDNRVVFQDMYSQNFLNSALNRNRLNAAYGEVKNRISDYSIRVGRQSAYGGGILGRFDGVTAGYGITSDLRINVAGGQLADQTIGEQPRFTSASIDFGVRSTLGGSLYTINQTAEGILDRQAIGGILRYFSQGKTAFAMVDFDSQFNQLNMFTLQGNLNTDAGTDYNFLIDHRRSPSLSIRNSVNGTSSSINTLLDNGFTINDLITLADQRTPVTDTAQMGLTNRLSEKWQLGTDISLYNTSALQQSGTQNPDFTTGVEGFVPATASTGNAWTFTERLMGNNLITSNDLTMFLLSYTTSAQIIGKQLIIHNHAIQNNWTFDTTIRMYLQNASTGGDARTISPIFRVGFKTNNRLTLESEFGVDWTNNRTTDDQTTESTRKYMALGFRSDF